MRARRGGRLATPSRRSEDRNRLLDRYLPRLRFDDALLRDVDDDHPVTAFGADALLVGVLRQREAARERAVAALDAMRLFLVRASPACARPPA